MELREKQSLPAALLGLAARLPWWLGLALAVTSFAGMHGVAQKPWLTAFAPGQAGGFVLSALTHLLALAGQFLLPAVFRAGRARSRPWAGARPRGCMPLPRSTPMRSTA